MRPAPDRATSLPLKAAPLAAALLLAATGATAQDDWTPGGDIRFGYVASETEFRDGSEADADSLRLRARLRMAGEIGGGWHAGVRVAALLDSDQNGDGFWMRTYAPTTAGLRTGEATFDEAWVEYRAANAPWRLRLGRFQAAFGLQDVMKKSLDQNDSPNFDITWVDGAWWQWRGQDWTNHVIVRHNDRRGPTGALHRPLAFTDSDSRASLFWAMETRTPVGPLVQRMLTVTWLPSALHPFGVTDPRNEDYLAVTAKLAAEWPAGGADRRLRIGAELGHAFDTPRREALGNGTGDADSLGWQASINLMDAMPGHDIGFVWGRVSDGWLLSSDFRANNTLAELRYVWRVSPAWVLDARVRHREEIALPATATQPREDDDIYLRATWKF